MTNTGSVQPTKAQLIRKYQDIRAFTHFLCEPLEIEDYGIQSMPDVSPTRWHLAHTAWFFETFLLKPEIQNYKTPNELYNFLFNSYYNAVGKQYPRAKRGHISRPTVAETYSYREHVDQEMLRLFETLDERKLAELSPIILLGLNHEQQHQELMLTDIKHVLFQNPLYPAYSTTAGSAVSNKLTPLSWTTFPGGRYEHGFAGEQFAFDNETPRHDILLQPFELANRLVTNADFLAFVEDGAYQKPALWLSDGWSILNTENWQTPLYWVKRDADWFEFTLAGLQPLDLSAPVAHLSFYESDAFANWSMARLPSEFEWELAAQQQRLGGNFVESHIFHPRAPEEADSDEIIQLYGDVWEWTRSPYTPYPGFRAATGAIGEYNGKFMSSQMVLRGGSCVTSQDHIRPTYRNFFYP
ncbi:MAG: ergothioneine biosynthesis protein EgtB, partial [Candidatus Marinimicrobia bacterium]|nr:ergothioneine biosynthesis protein EgtB [Candidatus Neomarinimicrobiota bacterium]